MRDSSKLWTGYVRFFLSNTPPAIGIGSGSGAVAVDLKWYNHVSQLLCITASAKIALSLAVVYHSKCQDNHVNLSRIFM